MFPEPIEHLIQVILNILFIEEWKVCKISDLIVTIVSLYPLLLRSV
jgi:hypothetical protein